MEKSDYYAVLGVAKGASSDEIRKAWRRKARELHPDSNRDDSNAEERFKAAQEAFDVLKDPERKAAYDRFGHAAFDGSMGGTGARHGFGESGGFAGSFGDVFGDLFNSVFSEANQGRAAGADLRFNMDLTLEEACSGVQRTITIPKDISCGECSGTGHEDGSVCQTCSGVGKVRTTQGFFTLEQTCRACRGRGMVNVKTCRQCGGQGLLQRDRTLRVNIPAGIHSGARVRMSGEGNAGPRGARSGDLYIFVNVIRHPLFERSDADLLCRVPIPVATAALGGEIEVPTINKGRLRVQIPEGSQAGTRLRLTGRGMPTLDSARQGDMLIELVIETPVNLNRKQKKLLREFEAQGTANNPESNRFLAAIQRYWRSASG